MSEQDSSQRMRNEPAASELQDAFFSVLNVRFRLFRTAYHIFGLSSVQQPKVKRLSGSAVHQKAVRSLDRSDPEVSKFFYLGLETTSVILTVMRDELQSELN